jgi:hypothetical protein
MEAGRPSGAPPDGASWRADRAALLVLAALAAVCVACLVANHDLPLVRNGIVYARAAENVIEHHFDGLAVVADSRLSYDKPIGFAWLAAPLLALCGTNLGLELVSCAGTLAYLVALFCFARAFDPFGFSGRERALLVLLAGCGPIVAYQSWSAHPDSLYAALYLATFVLAHRLVLQPSLGKVAGIALCIFASLMLKNYGAILIPSVAAYAFLHRKRFRDAPQGVAVRIALAVALALLAGLVWLGMHGHNPLMRAEGEGGGASQFGAGVWWERCLGTLAQVGITLLVNLHVALLPILYARRWPWAAIVSFLVPYVAGLMLFPATFYNMRYFLPLLPFAALLAVAGWRRIGARTARVLEAGCAALALALLLVFNCAPLYARVGRALPKLELTFTWPGIPLSLLDNLRMPMHLRQKAWIDNLNRNVEPGGLVYMLDVNYYGDAQQGVFERAGSIAAGVHTRYASSREFAPEEKRFYVQGAPRNRAQLEKLGKVSDLDLGLFHVER